MSYPKEETASGSWPYDNGWDELPPEPGCKFDFVGSADECLDHAVQFLSGSRL